MNITKTASALLLSGVATAVLMGQASALEAQAFLDRVTAVYKTVGYDLSFGPATLDGDTITVDGVTVGIVMPEGDYEPMTFDTQLTFSGVAEWDDGSYSAESLTIPDIDTVFADEDVEGRLTLSDVSAGGLWVPAGDPVPAVAMLQLFESFTAGPLSVFRNGEEVISIEGLEASSTFNPEQGMDLTDVSSTLSVSGIWANLTSVSEEDPSAGAVIEALGLTEISGNIVQEMTWNMADGHMNLSQFSFDFDEVGALDITAEITGFTPAVLDQIYAMQAQMAASGEATEEQAQAQMMQGMAIMQGVSIVGASVRYDDASLAGKLLDFFAASSGADRATFVEGIKAMLPGMIAETGLPALADLVVPPVSAFLDDPQSLEVKVAPASPTSLLVLMAAAANPEGLIGALGLAVEANTPAE